MRTSKIAHWARRRGVVPGLVSWPGLLLFLSAVGAAMPVRPANPTPPEPQRTAAIRHGILILATRSPSDLWTTTEVDGMPRFFQQQTPAIIPKIDYMDWQNDGGEEQEKRMPEYYAAKYAGGKICGVIAQDSSAPALLLKYRDTLFPGSQGVFCGTPSIGKHAPPPWLTGVPKVNDTIGSFQLARELQPNLRRFVMLDDVTAASRTQLQAIRESCAADAPDISFELPKTDNVQQLSAAIEALQPDSAVQTTRSRLASYFMAVLREHCPVPFYGLLAPLHLPGILGGLMLDGTEHGAAAARLAQRLYGGERAETIPIITESHHRRMVNYGQMVRFGLPLSALPAWTEVLGRPPGIFQTHGRALIVGGSLVLVLLAAIAFLTWMLRQKRASEKALSRSLSMLNATFDSISDGVLVVDLHGSITSFNEHFLEMWGIPRDVDPNVRDEVLLRYVRRHLKDPDTFLAKVKSLYAHPEEYSSDIVEFKDGRVFDRDSRPQRDGGKIVGRVWSFRNITARITAEEDKHHLIEQLAQSQKMEAVGTLAGGIAHDFNNILTGVIGYAELARARLPASHPSSEDLACVLTAGERARDLVRRILTFSRKHKPEKSAVSLKPVIGEILHLLRATTPASIEIHSELQRDDDYVLADTAQIHQAILNLATNAAHAMSGGPGTLNVGLETISGSPQFARENPRLLTGKWARVSVGDTGHGIAPATLRRIFEPFYTTKQPGEGTGLGLAVVHGIVTAHGGIVTVESEPGKGAAFHLHFPVVEKPCHTPVQSTADLPRGHGERVLIVEDETAVAEVARNYLTGLGYRPSVCHSPGQALAELGAHTHEFAAVLTDLSMPQMTGLDLIRRIRAQDSGLPCVLCTGFVVSASTEMEASHLGVVDVVTKPYSRGDLANALDRALHGVRVI